VSGVRIIVRLNTDLSPKTSMSKKHKEMKSPLDPLKSDEARQRWEMFHRAIAYAKASNNAAMIEADAQQHEAKPSGPLLSIVR